ncbi:MAG: class A beta-lactamase-related serine hydrolase [Bacteroidetes bacterium]|nr:class A beta-lactamase-related serine hydrolase [Bacteroidota bacterium]
MRNTFSALLFLSLNVFAQEVNIPDYYSTDSLFSSEINKIVLDLELDKDFNVGEDGIEQISFAVIDLTEEKPTLGGVNYDNFIYPASVYKMYVAAEIFKQISSGKFGLYDLYVVKSPNDVDHSKEIKSDPRPLLKNGDSVTVNYLLDLMITRSDNSAANCLIDLAKRENINKLIEEYNWAGSEVTRKFLKRKFEDPGYEKIRGTETCALHAADFMYRVYSNQLVNPWVSMQMKALLGRQLDKSKLAQGLPDGTMYYHKTGWFSYWTNDVGIVDDGKVKYIISCFIPLGEEVAKPKMKELSDRIYKLITVRNFR